MPPRPRRTTHGHPQSVVLCPRSDGRPGFGPSITHWGIRNHRGVEAGKNLRFTLETSTLFNDDPNGWPGPSPTTSSETCDPQDLPTRLTFARRGHGALKNPTDTTRLSRYDATGSTTGAKGLPRCGRVEVYKLFLSGSVAPLPLRDYYMANHRGRY
jgi:hypothetical protein